MISSAVIIISSSLAHDWHTCHQGNSTPSPGQTLMKAGQCSQPWITVVLEDMHLHLRTLRFHVVIFMWWRIGDVTLYIWVFVLLEFPWNSSGRPWSLGSWPMCWTSSRFPPEGRASACDFFLAALFPLFPLLQHTTAALPSSHCQFTLKQKCFVWVDYLMGVVFSINIARKLRPPILFSDIHLILGIIQQWLWCQTRRGNGAGDVNPRKRSAFAAVFPWEWLVFGCHRSRKASPLWVDNNSWCFNACTSLEH